MKDFLDLGIEGVVEVYQTQLYVKSPEALQLLFSELQELGYEVKSYANRSFIKSIENRIKEKSPLWTATVKSNKARELYHDKTSRLFNKPETVSIFETWNWAPLNPSADLHRDIIYAIGMTSNCGFYNNDEDVAFKDFHLSRMRRFVEHFTTLPIGQWDEMIYRAKKSGPSMIRTIYSFIEELRPLPINS